MAKVSLWGATYTDVPAVELPDGDGGASVFYENGGGSSVEDVQVNGVSVVDDGVANVPVADANTLGVVKVDSSNGIYLTSNTLALTQATDAQTKAGTNSNYAVCLSKQHMSTFYGLAKAAGDTTQSQSANPVGTYTDNAKTAIKAMLGITDADASVHVVEYDFDGGEPFLVDVTYNDINGWHRNNELVALYSASAAKAYYLSHMALGHFMFLGMDGYIFLVKSDDTCEIIESKYARENDVGSEFENVYSELEQKYSKPSTGIPASDLASGVQTSLGNADTAYQKPSTGIPSTDLASAVQTSLANADTAYQKPSTGIPSTDLASGVQTSLTNADSAYQKPVTGIPSTDLASSAQTSLSKADTAYQKPSTGIPASDLASGVIPSVPVQDVQVNGTSVLGAGGVANIVKATDAQVKAGVETGKILVPSVQDASTFYGLAKAAGSDEKNSSLAVGTYTDAAKSAISQMLNAPVSVSGTTPAITGLAGVRYICGECATLSIVAPESGCIDVVFTSGSTATVLTVTSAKTGVTAIKWANGFDPTSLEANTVYEVNILDGEFGVVGAWT